MRVLLGLVLAAGLALLPGRIGPAGPLASEAGSAPPWSERNVDDVAQPDGLPVLGKWMLDRDGSPAHWLGEIYEGKGLREPINIIIVDGGAASDAAAGYPIRMGHSAGYRAVIGGQTYSQLPTGWDDAFSNNLFELSNNHGRLFGPRKQGAFYVFVGAFSREEVSPFRWPEHRYGSFNRARDDFSEQLHRWTPFKRVGSVGLDNAIRDDPRVTTGDHDGKAVLLRADP
jgi:hypothetical protein